MTKMLCTKCPGTTVDLKLTVSAPSSAQVSVLPTADFLVITWTEGETGALALVFGNGKYKFETSESNNFTPLLYPGIPLPVDAKVHAYFFQAKVNGKTVVLLKSEFHPKFDPESTQSFFEKALGSGANPNFKYLVTSGTAGGIWAIADVGDVVVTNSARYGLTMPAAKQALQFSGAANILGSNPPAGSANWYDYVTNVILMNDACVSSGLLTAGGRKASSGKSSIYYKPNGTEPTDVVTNSSISTDEFTKLATYRTMGATLDENDAYVAQACKAIGFQNWVSIRNVSDLPSPTNNDAQYDAFQFCSSINGAYAVWAFLMGH
jgi:nucleoside phosphorylase